MSGSKSLHLFDDNKFKLEDKDESSYLKTLYTDLTNSILLRNNICKPTAKQMSDFYHKD
jgi:hypothetical protein